MEEYETLYPMPVSFFSSQAIVLYANDAANLIDELGRAQGGHLGMSVSLSRKGVRSIVDIVDRPVQVNLNRSTNDSIIHAAVSYGYFMLGALSKMMV